MKHRILSWLGAGALLASTGLNVYFGECLRRGCAICERPSPAAVQECIDCLGLTQDQCVRLQQQSLGCCSVVTSAEQGIAELQARLRQTLHADPVDEQAVRNLGRELAQRRGDAVIAGVEAALQMRTVLTHDQLTALLQQFDGGR
jgi:phage tail protein X